MTDTYAEVQDLLTSLLLICGTADAVAAHLVAEDNTYGLAALRSAQRVNHLADSSDDGHTAVYDWMTSHDAEGWDDDTVDVDDDMMDACFCDGTCTLCTMVL